MPELEFVQQNEAGLEEVRINDQTGIQAPFFIPELTGPEDLEALLNGLPALDENNPVMVPGYRWQDIRSKPTFKDKRSEIKRLLSTHPFFYYEPVELYRFKMPMHLVTYAFQGNRSKSREFYKQTRKGEVDQAISMLPTFFQPFLEAQIERLLEKTDDADPDDAPDTKNRKIHESWRDERADKGFTEYFDYLVEDAQRSPNVSVIPPVPPILASSDRDAVTRTFGVNRYMTSLCEKKGSGMSGNRVYSYFHLYIDQGAFKSGSNKSQQIISKLKDEIVEFDYAGVAVTISNYDRAWENGLEKSIEKFVNRVSNIAGQQDLPVTLPRSNWYGAYLTDSGVQSFSSPLNGNERKHQRSTGGMGKKARYGTVAMYGEAFDLNVSQLETVLERNGQVHDVDHLPSEPPTFAPEEREWKQKFGKARQFRVEFAKPRRLVHSQEAREFREDIKAGVPNPAEHYFRRSQHPHLS
jgi:hypothetical protein